MLLTLCLPSQASSLPDSIKNALSQYNLPDDSISIHVEKTRSNEQILDWRSDQLINPASTLKIITTYAGLDLLGADFTWDTEFFADGPIIDGQLNGDLYIKGSGDPLLINETLEQAIIDIRNKGITTITGNLMIDNSYFETPHSGAKSIYGHLQDPYQALPDAANINFGTVEFNIVTSKYSSRPKVYVNPPLSGYKLFSRIRNRAGKCRGFSIPKIDLVPYQGITTISISGQYPKRCGNRTIYRVITSPDRLLHGAFKTIWKKNTGQFSGGFKYAKVPQSAKLIHTLISAPLNNQIAVMNKKSNNVMTRQLFLTLGAEKHSQPGTLEKSRQVIKQWLKDKDINVADSFFDNGSGLSRKSVLTTKLLTDVLNDAAKHPLSDQFMDSLSIAGVDGTMRNRFVNHPAQGNLFIKTGTLNGVRAIAGYVNSRSGEKYTVATIQQHPGLGNGRGKAIQNAILDWAYQQ